MTTSAITGSSSFNTSAPSVAALPVRQPRLVIRASAGTGKTFQLSNRYIALLRAGEPDRILASTFTRKAAGEILERILIRLAKAGLDHKELEQLKPHVGHDGPELTQQECLQLLRAFTQQLHRIRISTLDGFFSRLAGTFALELGLPPGWRIMEESEAAQLQDQAIETILRDGAPRDLVQLMHLLDKGNSRRSVHQLVTDKVNDFYGVYLESAPESWNQFPPFQFLTDEQRVELIELIQAVPLTDGRLEKRRATDCELMLTDNWEKVATDGLFPRVMAGEGFHRKEIPTTLAALYRRLEPQVRAAVIAPLAHQTQATRQLLDDFHRAYERLKQEAGGLRFDDVTRRLLQRLGDRRTSDLAYRMDGEIEHVLLDEFQDTSPAQWGVIRPFAEAVCTGHGTTFFCVGDTKQAIYGWRGGEAAIFETIERQLPDVTTQPLNRSYRSSPVIMETVNRIFSQIDQHEGFDESLNSVLKQWSRDFPEHDTERTEFPGYARLITGPIPPDFEGNANQTAPLKKALWEYAARYVAERLREAPGATIGILTRTNDAVARMIYELGRLGIEASEEGGSYVTDSAGVQLILSLLKLADHPGDTISRFHVSRSPLGEAIGYLDHVDDEFAHEFALSIRQRLLQAGYGPVVHDWARQLAPVCNRREERRLRQLCSLADTFDATTQTLRPTEFVSFASNQRVQEPSHSQVRVMTVHQSKGLEFDTVVLAELDKLVTSHPSYVTWIPTPGAPPELVSLSAPQATFTAISGQLQAAYEQTMARQLNESLCMLYVAATRAVHSLHMLILPSVAKTRTSFPKTYAGLLRAALAPEASAGSEVTLYEAGDSRWFESAAIFRVRTECPTSTPVPLSCRLEQGPIPMAPGRGHRRIERIAPSRKKKATMRLPQVLPSGHGETLLRGTLFHRWLEEIRWLDEGRPADEILHKLARTVGAQHLDVADCIRQFDSMLRAPSIWQALSRGDYTDARRLPFSPALNSELAATSIEVEIVNERRFSLFDEGRLLNGSIDRLVLLTSHGKHLAADVIDYKTDQIPDNPAVIRDRIKHYAGQMTAYVRAVSRIYKLPPGRISARLILLTLGRVESVTFKDNNF